MIIFRRIAICFICCIIVIAPLLQCGVVYADTTTDNWQEVTTNEELAEAFQYYCKSRDLTIEGSAADAVTSFTSKTFQDLCKGLGINMTALQGHLKKETDGSNVRFLFDSTGITAYNQIFAQFLQDNDLEVGEPANENVYSGRYFTDDQNNSCIVFVYNSTVSTWQYDYSGTPYLFSTQFIKNSLEVSDRQVTVKGNSYGFYLDTYQIWDITTRRCTYTKTGYSNRIELYRSDIAGREGFVAVMYDIATDKLYYGAYFPGSSPYGAQYNNSIWQYMEITDGLESSSNLNIYLTSNNTVINNNNYEGDTIISNQPDNNDPSDPGDPPDYDPYPDGGGTTTSPSDGNGGGGTDGTITIPDLDFNLPEINWSLGDLSNKFPFSIPFDLVSLVRVLDAPAEAPRFQGTMNLGITTYDYDINLEGFSTVATACRKAEVIAFIFGLIIITRNLIRG